MRRALSPVIATVILSGVVLAVGGAIWSYSLGASSVIANSYVNDTLSLLDEVTERFTVEHINCSSDGSTLSVWIYNYGEPDVVVDVYVYVDDGGSGQSMENLIPSGQIVRVDVALDQPLEILDEVSIKVYSRRQNSVYETYLVS